MTVALMVKVNDGLVLAADSATTMIAPDGRSQVYNNALKVFQLHRKHPVAAMTWGLGNLGVASIATIAKDVRRRLMGRHPDHLDWQLADDYKIEDVVEKVRDCVFDRYKREVTSAAPETFMGLLVAGFSSGSELSQAWQLDFADPAVEPTARLVAGENQSGWAAFGQPEATQRLFNGFDAQIPTLLQNALPAAEWAKVASLFQTQMLTRTPYQDAMPLADAIDLARFLVDATAGYTHFLFGPDTVGGPTEVASLNRYEGFKWVARKHYYSAQLNPEEPTSAY